MNPCHIGDQPVEAVSAITDHLKGSFLNNGSTFKDECACGAQGEIHMKKPHFCGYLIDLKFYYSFG